MNSLTKICKGYNQSSTNKNTCKGCGDNDNNKQYKNKRLEYNISYRGENSHLGGEDG